MHRLYKITYSITYAIILSTLLCVLIIMEKFFVGLTALSSYLSYFLDKFLWIVGLFTLLFAIVYFLILSLILFTHWIVGVEKAAVFLSFKLSRKKNLKIMGVAILLGICAIILSVVLVRNYNTIKVINNTDQRILNVKVDGINKKELLKGESITIYPIEQDFWQLNDRGYDVKYEIDGQFKSLRFTENIGISKFKLDQCIAEEEEPYETNEIFETFDVSEKATFPEGDEGLQRFIAENITYPPMALENDMQGTVNVMFVVDKNGRVKDIKILGGKKGFGLEEEAMRVIKKTSGRWKPAKHRDITVNMRFRIPVKFQIF